MTSRLTNRHNQNQHKACIRATARLAAGLDDYPANQMLCLKPGMCLMSSRSFQISAPIHCQASWGLLQCLCIVSRGSQWTPQLSSGHMENSDEHQMLFLLNVKAQVKAFVEVSVPALNKFPTAVRPLTDFHQGIRFRCFQMSTDRFNIILVFLLPGKKTAEPETTFTSRCVNAKCTQDILQVLASDHCSGYDVRGIDQD